MSFFDGHIHNLGTIPDALLTPLIKKVLANDASIWEKTPVNRNRGISPQPVQQQRNTDKVFADTQHTIFQFPVLLRSHKESEYKPLWEEWQHVITPIIDHATQYYNYSHGKTARIMLAKVCAGGSIPFHTDTHKSAKVPHKIHVPLQTSPGAKISLSNSAIADETNSIAYHLQLGHAYELNNLINHSVHNQSDQARIHLIFDYFNAVEL